MTKALRVLLLGEYSNVHATLAKGLRERGCDVCVVSNGDFWKDYPRDIDVSRPNGPLAGVRLYARIIRLLPKLRGYDVVQLINPMFLELRAERLLPIYKYLRRHNRRMVLGAFGMDYYWVSQCLERRHLKYSDFNIGATLRTDDEALGFRKDWVGTAKERLNKHIANDADNIVTGLYEYNTCYEPLFPDKTTFIPYPIVLSDTTCTKADANAPLKVFLGVSKNRSKYKGTDVMERAVRRLLNDYPSKIALVRAEGVPFNEYQRLMEGSDIMLDQLYSYTPAMNALLAMSKGIVVVGGGEEAHYELLGETELRPIINVEPTEDSVYRAIEQIILYPDRLRNLKNQSIEYIRRHHDYLKVADKYLKLFTL